MIVGKPETPTRAKLSRICVCLSEGRWRGVAYNKMGQERFQDKLARCVRLQDTNDVSAFCLELPANLKPNIDILSFLVKQLYKLDN